MTNLEMAKALKNGMFADRETIRIAINEALSVAARSDSPVAVTTAVMVLVNTIANQIIENEQETV